MGTAAEPTFHWYISFAAFQAHLDYRNTPPRVHGGSYLNRPLFAGERLVRMLGCFFIWVQGCIEHLLCFMRRDISDGAVQALGVVPIDPFQRFPFKLAH